MFLKHSGPINYTSSQCLILMDYCVASFFSAEFRRFFAMDNTSNILNLIKKRPHLNAFSCSSRVLRNKLLISNMFFPFYNEVDFKRIRFFHI